MNSSSQRLYPNLTQDGNPTIFTHGEMVTNNKWEHSNTKPRKF